MSDSELKKSSSSSEKKSSRKISKESAFLFYVIFFCLFTFLIKFRDFFSGDKTLFFILTVILVVASALNIYLMRKNRIHNVKQIFCDIEESEATLREDNTDNSPNYVALQVMAKRKTANTLSPLFFALEQSELPQVSDQYTLTDFNQTPLVEVKITALSRFTFGEMTAENAQKEGFDSLEMWQRYYQNQFNQSLKQTYVSWWTVSNLKVETEQNLMYQRLADTDEQLGIAHRRITDSFEILFEQFEITRIYPMTYSEWQAFAVGLLQENQAQDPYLNPKTDANLLLQAVTKRTKSAIFAFGETVLTETEMQQLAALLARRVAGEPMAYILGEREFWSLPLKTSPHTLIPRPDTECLVEQALAWAHKRLENQAHLQILDLGTGTGAIALALAHELGNRATITGVDFKAEAVALAQQNRANLQLENAYFLQSDWFSALSDQRFDLIVSNPPYIDAEDPHLRQGDVRFEPLSALVAEDHGLRDLQNIIENAPLHLSEKGALFLEHGWQQAADVQAMFHASGWISVATYQDYGGQDRITKAERAA